MATDKDLPEVKESKSFWNTTLGTITKITALLTAITGLILAVKPYFKSESSSKENIVEPSGPVKPIIPKKHDVGLQAEKNNSMRYLDPQKGDFSVVWRRLSLFYDGSNLEYDLDLDLNFSGCSSCLAQVMIWVDGDHNACIYDGSANIINATRNGYIPIPKSLAIPGSLDTHLAVTLENNCFDGQTKRRAGLFAQDKIVGMIPHADEQ